METPERITKPLRPLIRKPNRKLIVVLLSLLGVFLLGLLLPEELRIPVHKAARRDWHPNSYWAEPWGASGVHKGIDIFAPRATPVLAPTYGVVLFNGELSLGGKVIVLLGPKWRLHYFAHLETQDVFWGQPVRQGAQLGSVGDSGNAKGKAPHLHYSLISLLPQPWRADASTQGWKKTFYLNPSEMLSDPPAQVAAVNGQEQPSTNSSPPSRKSLDNQRKKRR
jgi:peptidoglycan LD-endopeptidase LytH